MITTIINIMEIKIRVEVVVVEKIRRKLTITISSMANLKGGDHMAQDQLRLITTDSSSGSIKIISGTIIQGLRQLVSISSITKEGEGETTTNPIIIIGRKVRINNPTNLEEATVARHPIAIIGTKILIMAIDYQVVAHHHRAGGRIRAMKLIERYLPHPTFLDWEVEDLRVNLKNRRRKSNKVIKSQIVI